MASSTNPGTISTIEHEPCEAEVGDSTAPQAIALNARQRRFVAEYLKDANATAAYKRSGYSATGASADSAASRLLGNVEIKRLIVEAEAQYIAQVSHETGITLERTLREIAKGAFYDPRKFFAADGSLKPVSDLDDDTAAALAGFEVSEITGEHQAVIGHTKKIKLADRKGYLDILMKHLGGYKKDNDQNKPVGVAAELAAFVSQLHQSGAGRLPIAPQAPQQQ